MPDSLALQQATQPNAWSPALLSQSSRPSKGPRLEQRALPALRHLEVPHGGPICRAWSPAVEDGYWAGPSPQRRPVWGLGRLAVGSLQARSGTTPSLRRTPDPRHLRPQGHSQAQLSQKVWPHKVSTAFPTFLPPP